MRKYSPFYDEVDDGSRAGEGPVGGQKDGDVSGIQFARVGAKGRHQPLEGAGLDQSYPDRLPLQMGDLVVRVLPWGERV